MTGLPPYLAFLLGGLIGVVSYGPVKRWIVALRRALAHPQEQPSEVQGNDSRLLLLIFATMHPAPWLLIVGTPFALYQLTWGPLPLMWLRVFVGMLMGVALILLHETRLTGSSRS
jgi:sterol desaturase/sphingolipid hydroxylase (fatty acid hydroxylase superfamily)